MPTSPSPRPVVLCVLDGWGYRPDPHDNAVAEAKPVNFTRLWNENPHALLRTDGLAVGLPEGQMGNSEVGHLTIGAGRVLMQDLPRIDRAIRSGALSENPELAAFIGTLKKSGGMAHLMGLVSPGGVHAHQDHMLALARIIAAAGVLVAIHAFTDGRDVPPQSAAEQVKKLEDALPEGATIATVSGRYYAMDRDKRWERVELAYRAVAEGKGRTFTTAAEAIKASYLAGVFDEFVKPAVINRYVGIEDGDGLLFTNFRADRARELLTALLDPAFKEFSREPLKFGAALGMVEYSSELNAFLTPLFPPKELTEVLGEVVSKAGKTQLRLAETEKYAHVTFFLNGGEEKVYAGEERIIVPSPKVATYDLQPEMAAAEVTQHCVAAIESGKFDLIVLNFANGDMVGHTGMLKAAVKAVQAVDAGIGAIAAALEKVGGALLITADHGNCEELYDATTQGPHTAHTLNPVPVILMGAPKGAALRDGTLEDVAPTLLKLMGLPQPAVMTGKSLF